MIIRIKGQPHHIDILQWVMRLVILSMIIRLFT